jgi:TFIIF-interacting CTD phosphatase-like protein
LNSAKAIKVKKQMKGKEGRKTLVLDLDETLIHTSHQPFEN